MKSILTEKVVFKAQLWKHDLSFALNAPQIAKKKKIKQLLVEVLKNENLNDLLVLYEFAKENCVDMVDEIAKTIDKRSLLQSLMLQDRKMESYVFNKNFRILPK